MTPVRLDFADVILDSCAECHTAGCPLEHGEAWCDCPCHIAIDGESYQMELFNEAMGGDDSELVLHPPVFCEVFDLSEWIDRHSQQRRTG